PTDPAPSCTGRDFRPYHPDRTLAFPTRRASSSSSPDSPRAATRLQPHTARSIVPALSSSRTPSQIYTNSRSRPSRKPRRPRRAGIISPRFRQLNLVLTAGVSEEQRGSADTRRAEDDVAAVG